MDSKSIFRPKDLHVCQWTSDPRYCGAYSAALVGCFENEKHWDDFVDPLPRGEDEDDSSTTATLFFAGEAYSERHGGYMQGALETG